MKIPFLKLTHHSDELNKEFQAAFRRVMERGNFILGAEVEGFEREWAQFCEVSGAVAVANGTDAITLALTASGVIEAGRGDEVITTPLTAAYTSLAILNAGATPVFVDLDERTFNLSSEKIEAAITPHTRAIMPVHLYGQPVDMKAVSEIAERNNLFVIEDAAQAHGARSAGKSIGSLSGAATFSFYPTKNLGAYGDGGAIISNDEKILDKLRVLRQGGHLAAIQTDLIGRNSRLDEMQAAFLRIKLKRLAESNARRSELARIYFEKLANISRVTLPFVSPSVEPVFHLFVIRHPQRDKLKAFLAERGIECVIHYPYLLHEQKLFRRAGQMSLPVAETIVREILSLPLNPQMENAEIESVCEAIADFENQNLSALSYNANR